MTRKAVVMREATPPERKHLFKAICNWQGFQLRGGLARRRRRGPEHYDLEQLAIGIVVELEHTMSNVLAMEIAMSHLEEDRLYYAKLEKMET